MIITNITDSHITLVRSRSYYIPARHSIEVDDHYQDYLEIKDVEGLTCSVPAITPESESIYNRNYTQDQILNLSTNTENHGYYLAYDTHEKYSINQDGIFQLTYNKESTDTLLDSEQDRIYKSIELIEKVILDLDFTDTEYHGRYLASDTQNVFRVDDAGINKLTYSKGELTNLLLGEQNRIYVSIVLSSDEIKALPLSKDNLGLYLASDTHEVYKLTETEVTKITENAESIINLLDKEQDRIYKSIKLTASEIRNLDLLVVGNYGTYLASDTKEVYTVTASEAKKILYNVDSIDKLLDLEQDRVYVSINLTADEIKALDFTNSDNQGLYLASDTQEVYRIDNKLSQVTLNQDSTFEITDDLYEVKQDLVYRSITKTVDEINNLTEVGDYGYYLASDTLEVYSFNVNGVALVTYNITSVDSLLETKQNKVYKSIELTESDINSLNLTSENSGWYLAKDTFEVYYLDASALIKYTYNTFNINTELQKLYDQKQDKIYSSIELTAARINALDLTDSGNQGVYLAVDTREIYLIISGTITKLTYNKESIDNLFETQDKKKQDKIYFSITKTKSELESAVLSPEVVGLYLTSDTHEIIELTETGLIYWTYNKNSIDALIEDLDTRKQNQIFNSVLHPDVTFQSIFGATDTLPVGLYLSSDTHEVYRVDNTEVTKITYNRTHIDNLINALNLSKQDRIFQDIMPTENILQVPLTTDTFGLYLTSDTHEVYELSASGRVRLTYNKLTIDTLLNAKQNKIYKSIELSYDEIINLDRNEDTIGSYLALDTKQTIEITLNETIIKSYDKIETDSLLQAKQDLVYKSITMTENEISSLDLPNADNSGLYLASDTYELYKVDLGVLSQITYNKESIDLYINNLRESKQDLIYKSILFTSIEIENIDHTNVDSHGLYLSSDTYELFNVAASGVTRESYNSLFINGLLDTKQDEVYKSLTLTESDIKLLPHNNDTEGIYLATDTHQTFRITVTGVQQLTLNYDSVYDLLASEQDKIYHTVTMDSSLIEALDITNADNYGVYLANNTHEIYKVTSSGIEKLIYNVDSIDSIFETKQDKLYKSFTLTADEINSLDKLDSNTGLYVASDTHELYEVTSLVINQLSYSKSAIDDYVINLDNSKQNNIYLNTTLVESEIIALDHNNVDSHGLYLSYDAHEVFKVSDEGIIKFTYNKESVDFLIKDLDDTKQELFVNVEYTSAEIENIVLEDETIGLYFATDTQEFYNLTLTDKVKVNYNAEYVSAQLDTKQDKLYKSIVLSVEDLEALDVVPDNYGTYLSSNTREVFEMTSTGLVKISSNDENLEIVREARLDTKQDRMFVSVEYSDHDLGSIDDASDLEDGLYLATDSGKIYKIIGDEVKETSITRAEVIEIINQSSDSYKSTTFTVDQLQNLDSTLDNFGLYLTSDTSEIFRFTIDGWEQLTYGKVSIDDLLEAEQDRIYKSIELTLTELEALDLVEDNVGLYLTSDTHEIYNLQIGSLTKLTYNKLNIDTTFARVDKLLLESITLTEDEIKGLTLDEANYGLYVASDTKNTFQVDATGPKVVIYGKEYIDDLGAIHSISLDESTIKTDTTLTSGYYIASDTFNVFNKTDSAVGLIVYGNKEIDTLKTRLSLYKSTTLTETEIEALDTVETSNHGIYIASDTLRYYAVNSSGAVKEYDKPSIDTLLEDLDARKQSQIYKSIELTLTELEALDLTNTDNDGLYLAVDNNQVYSINSGVLTQLTYNKTNVDELLETEQNKIYKSTELLSTKIESLDINNSDDHGYYLSSDNHEVYLVNSTEIKKITLNKDSLETRLGDEQDRVYKSITLKFTEIEALDLTNSDNHGLYLSSDTHETYRVNSTEVEKLILNKDSIDEITIPARLPAIEVTNGVETEITDYIPTRTTIKCIDDSWMEVSSVVNSTIQSEFSIVDYVRELPRIVLYQSFNGGSTTPEINNQNVDITQVGSNWEFNRTATDYAGNSDGLYQHTADAANSPRFYTLPDVANRNYKIQFWLRSSGMKDYAEFCGISQAGELAMTNNGSVTTDEWRTCSFIIINGNSADVKLLREVSGLANIQTTILNVTNWHFYTIILSDNGRRVTMYQNNTREFHNVQLSQTVENFYLGHRINVDWGRTRILAKDLCITETSSNADNYDKDADPYDNAISFRLNPETSISDDTLDTEYGRDKRKSENWVRYRAGDNGLVRISSNNLNV